MGFPDNSQIREATFFLCGDGVTHVILSTRPYCFSVCNIEKKTGNRRLLKDTFFFHPLSAPWTPVTKIHLGDNYLNTVTTHSYSIPSIIPDTAREVFFHAVVNCRSTSASYNEHVHFYVELNGIRYTQYVYMYAFSGSGINTDSDNTWLPMPSDRLVHITTTVPFTNCQAAIQVIGYR